MALEGCVHAVIKPRQFARIEADQVRRQLSQAGPNSFGVRRQIERPQRAHLAIADKPGVGLDADNRAVEYRHRFTARPLVAAFVQREVYTVSENTSNFHASAGLAEAAGIVRALQAQPAYTLV